MDKLITHFENEIIRCNKWIDKFIKLGNYKLVDEYYLKIDSHLDSILKLKAGNKQVT